MAEPIAVTETPRSLQDEVNRFVEEHLPRDTEKWCRSYSGKDKIIHDALWGTFRLEPHEVALIDTPLFQRLRFVHQTGGTRLVYPSCQHTRFEHSLGVLYQTERICNALSHAAARDNRFEGPNRATLRYAALIHDTGHGPFSHTSEQYFASMPDMRAYREANEDEFPESGEGEILSYLITGSPAFINFCHVINGVFKQDIKTRDIQQFITGTIENDRLYLSEILHGPLDADKLDYMPRDGLFSGLKTNVDIDRLYHSIEVISAEVDGERQSRLGGKISGSSPLTQLMFNKMLLFTGIYHHHKVRAADCMLWAMFDLAVQRRARLGGRLLSSVADFLHLSDDMVLLPELTDDDEIRELIVAIRNRRLWKRALVISRQTINESLLDDVPSESRPFNEFGLLAGNAPDKLQRRRELAAKIWEAADRPCKLHEIWLDVPKQPAFDEAERMWISAAPGDAPITLKQVLPISHWVELYGTHKWRAHVFCPEGVIDKINIAARNVLELECRLEFNDHATKFAKISI